MAGNSINPTTIWTPQGGFGNWGQQLMDQGAPQRQEFLMLNPRYNAADPSSGPEYIQDPTATGTPTAFSNDAGTRGVLNPFGLTQNRPEFGYLGSQAPAHQAEQAATPQGPGAGAPDNSGGGIDNRPPDQRGFEGTFNPTTGLTGYATPQGQFMMDQFGNWTDQSGNPVDFDQSRGSAPMGTGANPGAPGGGATVPAIATANAALRATPGIPASSSAPASNGIPTSNPGAFGPGSYENNVQIRNPFGSNAANPFQFGTQATGQSIANRYGGTAYGAQLEGPGYGYSTPQQQVRFANGQNINAGLGAQALGRPEYGGGAAGSYGDYNVSRDVNRSYGGDYDSWARAQPGFRENPRLANTGPGVGNQYMGGAPVAQNTQGFTQQQANAYQQPGSYNSLPYNTSNSYSGGGLAQQAYQQRQNYQQQAMQRAPGSYGMTGAMPRRRSYRGGGWGQMPSGGQQWGAGFSGYRGA